MDLLKKIFPLSNMFAKQGTGKFILGAVIYVAAMVILSFTVIVPLYAALGLLVMILIECDAFGENDTMSDIWKKAFPLSYTFAESKEGFNKGLLIYIVGLFCPLFTAYAIAGLVLMIVAYCKNNKAKEATAENEAENSDAEIKTEE